MEKDAKVYVAGHKGLIGFAVVSGLKKEGYINLLVKSREEFDLTRQSEVEALFKKEKPQYVILAAAKVGGIEANIAYPAQFIFENLAIQNNVIHSAYLYKVKKLLFLGSACSYPRECAQPMKEEYLLSGKLEPTNEPYAIAKIAGMKMCQAYNQQYGTNFISAVVTNTYGLGDNFDPSDSHVIPALLRKFHEAKIHKEPIVVVWGSGNPRREFIYVDDVADATIFLMSSYDSCEIINIGAGYDISIKELARIIKEVVGYEGEITFDLSKADGIPQKMLDTSKLKTLGWQAKISLKNGLIKTYDWYKKHFKQL